MNITFYGEGSVYFPLRHSFIRFAGGEYKTEDPEEIALLTELLYKRNEVEAPVPEEPIVEYAPRTRRSKYN